MAHWMGLEGGDDDRAPFVRAALHGAIDHRLMAQMEAVEIAQREDRTAQFFGDRLVEGQALHRDGGLAAIVPESTPLTRRGRFHR